MIILTSEIEVNLLSFKPNRRRDGLASNGGLSFHGLSWKNDPYRTLFCAKLWGMWKYAWLMLSLLTVSCGYKVVGWSSSQYATLEVRLVEAGPTTRHLTLRMRDALIERCLAGSGFAPVDASGDLVLKTSLSEYAERVIATGTDGRTEQVQFTLKASFYLSTRDGREIWSLGNYQYSDQYAISTSQDSYRDETVFVQDQAMRTMADLVITNITLAISEEERQKDDHGKKDAVK